MRQKYKGFSKGFLDAQFLCQFICELRNARVPEDHVFMMCGKSTGDQGAYSEKRPEELFKVYQEN